MNRIAQSFPACILAVVTLCIMGAATADPNLPWELRNHYSIPVERGVLIYAEDNAEWRVLMDDGTVLADSIGFSVVLADGTELTGLNLEEGTASRDNFTDEVGDGTTYSVTFPPKSGLKISHILRTFKSRPFVFIEIKIENTGGKDVTISEIRPVVAKKSVMQSLSPETRIHYRRIQDTAGQPVVVPEQDALMAVIHDPAKPICFGLGFLPSGLARSTVGFRETSGAWHGNVVCRFDPGKALAPGETLAADPLWVSHGVPEAHRVDLYYSWAYSVYGESTESEFQARGWFTLPEDKGLSDYVAAGAIWKRAGIDHVLIGRGWEGRPGSLSGAASRFPKNMASATGTLTQGELKVGITIDPLIAREGGQSWTTDSADGQAWLDPTKPGAIKALGAKISTLKKWGVKFVVVEKSAVPDVTLEAMKLTRAEAQNAAYRALREAAAPIPVFPASTAAVRDNVDDWLDASSSVARMAAYGIVPGPLRCRLKKSSEVSHDLITAASFWPGPIEFQGVPGKRHQDGIADLITQERVPGHPVDADRRAPRTWEVKTYDDAGKLLEERTVSVGAGRAATARATSGSDETAS
jgi:hypothetical protein